MADVGQKEEGEVEEYKNENKIIKLNSISPEIEVDGKKLKKYSTTTLRKKIEELTKIKNDYYVGILSDQSYFSKKALLEKYSLLGDFKPNVISCDEGIRKPNKKIYELLKKKLDKIDKKIKYNEILFIDNRNWNLKPAKKLGMKTILFKNNKQTKKKLNKILNKNRLSKAESRLLARLVVAIRIPSKFSISSNKIF